MRSTNRAVLASSLVAAAALAACGGNDQGPTPVVSPTPVAEVSPTPSPSPTQPAPCRLTAPTVDCARRTITRPELAEPLQIAISAAVSTPGVMYADADRIYDLDIFRSKLVEVLTAKNICGAWDYGNVTGDEIFVRSEDGCVVEQYDLITGTGGVRNATKTSNVWQSGFEEVVPAVRPDYPKEGDLQCSLPGDRSTFCFSIKNSDGGEFGPRLYPLVMAVIDAHPELVDKTQCLPAQCDGDPGAFRPPAWLITNPTAYTAALEQKIRANGYCGYIENGDILKVKSVAKGNVFHEEIDVVQNPGDGGSYTSFTPKDRCHNAGF